MGRLWAALCVGYGLPMLWAMRSAMGLPVRCLWALPYGLRACYWRCLAVCLDVRLWSACRLWRALFVCLGCDAACAACWLACAAWAVVAFAFVRLSPWACLCALVLVCDGVRACVYTRVRAYACVRGRGRACARVRAYALCLVRARVSRIPEDRTPPGSIFVLAL